MRLRYVYSMSSDKISEYLKPHYHQVPIKAELCCILCAILLEVLLKSGCLEFFFLTATV